MDGLELVGPQEAQLVLVDVVSALPGVLPSGLCAVVGTLGQHDVVVADLFANQLIWLGRNLLVAGDRIGRRKRRDDVRVAAFEVPEVMQISVGEDDEAAVLRARVFARLFLADEWILVLGFCFQND